MLALSSDDGRSTGSTLLFAIAAASDYLDGFVARLTGQYSRLGALLDPFTDRLLIISGAIVAWEFELLPRWALAVLAAREACMLLLTRLALRRGLDVNINPIGRWAVWPTMSALGVALILETPLSEWLLYLGLTMTLAATVVYLRDGLRDLRAVGPSSST